MPDIDNVGQALATYATKYGLKKDPILSASELLQYGQPLANVRTGLPPSIEEWQEFIAEVLLVPQVPEAVRRTFSVAKRLFIFGYYEYSLSTVSQHYALLALEAALQARWSAALPRPCAVAYSNGIVTSFDNLTHKFLHDHWRADPKHKVNGETFPRSNHQLTACLEKMKIITAEDEKWILEAMEDRNHLSHLEFAPIYGPSDAALYFVAELINRMFDSLPLPAPSS